MKQIKLIILIGQYAQKHYLGEKLKPTLTENVKNFKFIEKGKPFNFLIDELASIVNEDGEQLYNIYCDIYNTKDYGIPQNRERIYIIGIKSDILVNEYIKPECIEMKPLDDIIIDKTIYKKNKNFKNINEKLEKIEYKKNYIFPK